MENREKDRMSQRKSPTDDGRINRDVTEERGREQNSGTGAEFGQSSGRAENLGEGGKMRNKDEKDVNGNVGMGNEQSRRPDSEGLGSSPGRRPGSMDDESSNISRDDKSTGNTGNAGSSEGRH